MLLSVMHDSHALRLVYMGHSDLNQRCISAIFIRLCYSAMRLNAMASSGLVASNASYGDGNASFYVSAFWLCRSKVSLM